jgi:predicted  nucleic acid-binding Zn-ribbon protein
MENRDLMHKIDTLNFEIERLKHEIREAKDAYKGLDESKGNLIQHIKDS